MVLTSGHRGGEMGSDPGLILKVAARIWGWVEFFKIHLFACARSSLQHAEESLVVACELLVAARGI